MYDPLDPPAQGIPADPLPADLPEGDSGEVTDDGVEEPVFDPYKGQVVHVSYFEALLQARSLENTDDA